MCTVNENHGEHKSNTSVYREFLPYYIIIVTTNKVGNYCIIIPIKFCIGPQKTPQQLVSVYLTYWCLIISGFKYFKIVD